MKSLLIILVLIPFVTASYFRKERVVKIEELTKPENTVYIGLKLLRSEHIYKVDTNEGNTYIITNNEDGLKISDEEIPDNFQIKENIKLRGYRTVENIIDDLVNKSGL